MSDERKRKKPSEPSGIEFYDARSQRHMKYVYPDAGHWTAGWILYKHPDGQWVTLRKATETDIAAVNKAVVVAHHSGVRP